MNTWQRVWGGNFYDGWDIRTSRSLMPFFSLRRFSESCRSILVDSNDQHLRRCGSDNNEVKGKSLKSKETSVTTYPACKNISKRNNRSRVGERSSPHVIPFSSQNLRKIWKNYNQFRFFPILRIFFFSCNTNSDTEMLKSHLKAGLWILSIRKGQRRLFSWENVGFVTRANVIGRQRDALFLRTK